MHGTYSVNFELSLIILTIDGTQPVQLETLWKEQRNTHYVFDSSQTELMEQSPISSAFHYDKFVHNFTTYYDNDMFLYMPTDTSDCKRVVRANTSTEANCI
jgi:hypothetical protein